MDKAATIIFFILSAILIVTLWLAGMESAQAHNSCYGLVVPVE